MSPSLPHSPTVSIMMPAYNAERFIALAIESVLKQSFSDWELLIVNDGSTDRTRETAAGFQDARILLIDQTNSGEAAARNTALQHVRGRYLAFLDSDDLYQPEHLKLTLNYLDTHSEKDAVYTDGIHCDQDGNLLKPLSSRRRGPFEGNLFEQVVRASDVFGPPMVVVLRSEAVFQRKLHFDPSIVIGPDWDFFTHYAEHANFGYLPVQTCIYRVHQTNISVTTGLPRRRGYMAICRTKAIKLPRFNELNLETRTAVFYDLLINLFHGQPDKQLEATLWPEFIRLPTSDQARLLRLMASKAIQRGLRNKYITDWLQRAMHLNPADRKSMLIYGLFRVHPTLSQKFLNLRTAGQIDPLDISPFADLYEND